MSASRPICRRERFVAEALLDALRDRGDVRGARVLYATAEGARDVLPDGLAELGASVDRVHLYRSVANTAEGDELKRRIAARRRPRHVHVRVIGVRVHRCGGARRDRGYSGRVDRTRHHGGGASDRHRRHRRSERLDDPRTRRRDRQHFTSRKRFAMSAAPRSTDGGPLIIATRASELAVRQARQVQEALAERGVAVELKTYRTTGDKRLDEPLSAIGGKGLLPANSRRDLAKGVVDCCVHSLKDLPTESPRGLGSSRQCSSAKIRATC